ncbi:ABC transporter substrate-binding protein [Acidaminococcus fermentans]|uniref:ABC transporter substrate-binding protein n=1 Tax=Acidaminococcus fermentans TaxID=905 RepID=UPI002E759DB7|nr:ABC transporter substrate-binding protein [Acidaminococcus fermentans]MEE1598119.1 ABC transporter substrate-binding protein [Acidaminococcus fermentans]MEE4122381.1 ABC transporter substrate-binding protein [Acidaminococcus fermentans]
MKLLRILGILFLFLTAGCGPAAPEQGGYTVEDVRGKTVRLARPPQKILTDSLHLDETLLTLVPADHLAGVYYLDREPGISFIAEETRDLEPVLRQVTPETVARTKPDLFLASTWSDPGLIQKVEEMGIPVVVCRGPVTVEEIRDNVGLMARALDRPEAGKQVLARMDGELEETERVLKNLQGPEPVGLLVSLMSRYGGSGSLYDDLCRRAHVGNGLSRAGLKNGQPLTREAILQADPDFFLVALPYGEEKADYEKFQQQFFADPALQGLKGLERRVALPDRYVYDASPMAVYGIRALANGAYGKVLFPQGQESLLKGY